MKKLAMSALLAGASFGALAQVASFSYFKYEGSDPRFDQQIDATKQYYNPILAGFYPDPSVARKGDTYYLVNSSFGFFPGVPIFESKDLVNWVQIGHVLDRESQLNLENKGVSEGIFAPAISYNPHNDTFYMITTLVGPNGGNFFVKTKDPHLGWSEPVWLPEIDGIDPSFLFDNDGKAYIVHNAPVFGEARYEGERAIRLFEFDPATDKIISEPLEILRSGTHITENPIWIEGPHLYHISDFYYLMCAEGGTAEDHREVILRAKDPKGPWEEAPSNPILTQRDLDPGREFPVSCTGHADIIQTPEGNWWAVFLGCRPYEANLYNTGRETFLLPVSWKDGWPEILAKGLPVSAIGAKANLLPGGEILSGNFSYVDNFDSNTLNPRWISLRNIPENAFSLDGGRLVLNPSVATLTDKDKRISALFARQQHPDFSVETEVEFADINPGDFAGLAFLQNENYNFIFGKTREIETLGNSLSDRNYVILERMEGGESKVWSAPIADVGPLKLKVVGNGKYYSFYYRLPGDSDWQPLAKNIEASNLSTAKAGGFIGTVIGPYASRKQ